MADAKAWKGARTQAMPRQSNSVRQTNQVVGRLQKGLDEMGWERARKRTCRFACLVPPHRLVPCA